MARVGIYGGVKKVNLYLRGLDQASQCFDSERREGRGRGEAVGGLKGRMEGGKRDRKGKGSEKGAKCDTY